MIIILEKMQPQRNTNFRRFRIGEFLSCRMGLSSGLPASMRGSLISGRIFDGLIISRSCSDYQPIKERNYDDFRKSKALGSQQGILERRHPGIKDQ